MENEKIPEKQQKVEENAPEEKKEEPSKGTGEEKIEWTQEKCLEVYR